MRLYRSHALDTRNAAIERALIMVHGQNRTSGNYFRSAMAAAFLAGALDNTIVIAPRFASNQGGECRDRLAADELNWVCNGPESWRNGGSSIDKAQVTSYHVTDEILQRLARKDVFPNLRVIVVAGHSAGGQYTTRYAMTNTSHDRIGISIRYVVANPSSYTYPDALRPTVNAAGQSTENVNQTRAASITFQAFAHAERCAAFDQWPYGVQRRVGYSAEFSAEQLIKQLTSRPTTFLVGEYDIFPVQGFDASCSAMAQGTTRLARGVAYGRYLSEKFGASHRTMVVPDCGHNARCIFTTNQVLPLLFPAE